MSTFLKKQSLNPTWQAVIDALKDEAVNEEALAAEIERRYGKPDMKQGGEEAVKPPVESTPTRECMTEL